jgi:uncharacterized LabA/DUF88 family protein
MRVLIFIDGKNFENGVFNLCEKRKEFRFIDFYKLNGFIMHYLENNSQYKGERLNHIRTYFYTGEFTDNLIEKIQRALEKNKEKLKEAEMLLERAKKDKEKQSKFFKIARDYYFFEVRHKPLQFNPADLRIFQKGVDVQLAADFVDFTHKNIFDIAVILSGDIDLLESIKIAKNMGKQVIIFSEASVTADEMRKYADLFINLDRLNDEQLDSFTHIHDMQKRSENNQK